jgi:hypothetical protein
MEQLPKNLSLYGREGMLFYVVPYPRLLEWISHGLCPGGFEKEKTKNGDLFTVQRIKTIGSDAIIENVRGREYTEVLFKCIAAPRWPGEIDQIETWAEEAVFPNTRTIPLTDLPLYLHWNYKSKRFFDLIEKLSKKPYAK